MDYTDFVKYQDKTVTVFLGTGGMQWDGVIRECRDDCFSLEVNGILKPVAYSFVMAIDPHGDSCDWTTSAVTSGAASNAESTDHEHPNDVSSHADNEGTALGKATPAGSVAVQTCAEPFRRELEQAIERLERVTNEVPDVPAEFKKRSQESGEDADTVREASAIVQQYHYAVKIRDDEPGSDRMRKTISKAKSGCRDYPNSQLLAGLHAFLLCANGMRKDSYEVWVQSGDYEAAIAVASDQMQRDVAVAAAILTNKAGLGARSALLALSPPKAVPLLEKLLEQDGDKEFVEDVFALAWKLTGFNEWRDMDELNSASNIAALKEWLSRQARDCQHVERAACMLPRRGTIKTFQRGRMFGFIEAPGIPFLRDGQIFFHLKQVEDESLRRILLRDDWQGLTVTFRMGEHQKGLAATEIRLRGVEPQPNAKKGTGWIDSYNRFSRIGQIHTNNGKLQSFNLSNVLDPLLKIHLENEYDMPSQMISFTWGTCNGHPQVEHLAPTEPFSEEKIRNWQQSGLIQAFQEQAGTEERETTALVEYGLSLPYIPLDLYVPGQQRKPTDAPTKNMGVTPEVVRRNDYTPGPEPNGSGPYSDGRRAINRRDFSRAEKLFKQAIAEEDCVESAVCDLLTLYIRQKDYDSAEAMFRAHEHRLPEEKRINNWITFYAASKRDPEKLIECYRRGLELTDKEGTRLHYTLNKAVLEFEIGRYEDCVASCDAGLHEAPRVSEVPGQAAHARISSARLKKRKVMALYFLRDKDSSLDSQIDEIARDLQRIWPDDPDLKAMLNRTWQRPTVDQRSNTVGIVEQWPAFLREQLLATSIDDLLITKYVTDSGYTRGHWQEADKEYGQITGTASKRRRMGRAQQHFAAAKYIYNFLQCADEDEVERCRQLTKNNLNNIAYKGLEQMAYACIDETEAKIDTMRYYCLLLLENEKAAGKCIDTSEWFRFYVCSYFEHGLKKENDSWVPEKVAALTRLDLKRDCDFDRFFDGLIALARVVGIAPLSKVLENCAYNPELAEDLRKRLEVENVGDRDVMRRFNGAVEAYSAQEGNLRSSLNNADYLRLDSLNDLRRLLRQLPLSKQDEDYRSGLIRILDLFSRYQEQTDFDNRLNDLQSIVSEADLMRNQIMLSPTEFAYQHFRSMLNDMRACATEEIPKLHQLTPKISVECRGVQRHGNKVTVVFCILNEVSRQKALTPEVQLDGLPGGAAVRQALEQPLVGGSPEECVVSFKLPDGYDGRSIDYHLSIHYTYKSKDQRVMSDVYNPTLPPLSLETEFEPMPNPYRSFANQGVVKDRDMVFGRENDINEVIRGLCDSNGRLVASQAIALYGQKRT
ncbi:cold shock domain-containing protein, partial [bacterium]|nr:cold shock domain-containing protein [bacterium]